MTITVSPANLDANLAHDLKMLLGDDPAGHTIEPERLKGLPHFGLVASSDGHLAGFAVVHESAVGSGQWFLHTLVPTGAPNTEHITETLFKEARGSAAQQTFSWWTEGRQAAVVAMVAERYGLSKSREVRQMTITLDAAVQYAEADFRPFHPDDSGAIVAINNRAFREHADRSNWTTETLAGALAEGHSRIFVSPSAGTLQGFCWIKTHGQVAGEIYVLATHPDFQGTGLGKKLLSAGLKELRNQGCREAELYVEGDNARAIKLYQDFGFTFGERTMVAYSVPPLAPGI